MTRNLIAYAISPALAITGFRFSKEYRHAEMGWKATVYRFVSTVTANITANKLSGKN